MRILDLFAGIGGFSLAAHWMGWQTAAFVERDKFCQAVLRKNFGQDIEVYDDITTFSGKPFRGRVDVITGGFPCQPFSAAGRREGVNDDRYLFPETLRVVREVQPAWVVLENVAGLLSMASEAWDTKLAGQPYTRTEEIDRYEGLYTRTEIMLLDRIREALEREGYAVQPVVIPASAVGAWHERKRIWIVGSNAQCSGLAIPKPRKQQFALRNAERDGSHAADTQRDGRSPGSRARGSDAAVREEPQRTNYAVDAQGADLLRVDDNHAERSRLEGHAQPGNGTKGRPQQDRPVPPTSWSRHWVDAATEFCGVAHGVPDRVDRIKSLGNAIVPQIAYEIFRAINEVDAG